MGYPIRLELTGNSVLSNLLTVTPRKVLTSVRDWCMNSSNNKIKAGFGVFFYFERLLLSIWKMGVIQYIYCNIFYIQLCAIQDLVNSLTTLKIKSFDVNMPVLFSFLQFCFFWYYKQF